MDYFKLFAIAFSCASFMLSMYAYLRFRSIEKGICNKSSERKRKKKSKNKKNREITLIAAVDKYWGISRDGKIPWYLPEDLKHFREITENGIVIMGRKTFETIGQPLKNRVNIIISGKYGSDKNSVDFNYEDFNVNWLYGEEYETYVVASIKGAMEITKFYKGKPIFIIGGKTIYNQFLPYCSKAIITKLEEDFKCDNFMPNLDSRTFDWELEDEESFRSVSNPQQHRFLYLYYKNNEQEENK